MKINETKSSQLQKKIDTVDRAIPLTEKILLALVILNCLAMGLTPMFQNGSFQNPCFLTFSSIWGVTIISAIAVKTVRKQLKKRKKALTMKKNELLYPPRFYRNVQVHIAPNDRNDRSVIPKFVPLHQERDTPLATSVSSGVVIRCEDGEKDPPLAPASPGVVVIAIRA